MLCVPQARQVQPGTCVEVVGFCGEILADDDRLRLLAGGLDRGRPDRTGWLMVGKDSCATTGLQKQALLLKKEYGSGKLKTEKARRDTREVKNAPGPFFLHEPKQTPCA